MWLLGCSWVTSLSFKMVHLPQMADNNTNPGGKGTMDGTWKPAEVVFFVLSLTSEF